MAYSARGWDNEHVTEFKREVVPGLRKVQMLPGCGRWTQQERAAEVSAGLLDFLRSLLA
jgi:hypothetical protein